jgi:hypothetical protein
MECDSPLPTAADMEAQIQMKIAQALSLAPSDWVSDEFGLHCPSTDSGERSGDFSNQVFCFNCGRQGHRSEKCDQPSFEALSAQFGDLRDISKGAVDRRVRIANELRIKQANSKL